MKPYGIQIIDKPISINDTYVDSISINSASKKDSQIENELKDLKKRKYDIDNQLEKKSEILNNLHEVNSNLQLVHKNLRNKLKDLNNGGSKKSSIQKRNSNLKEINSEIVEKENNCEKQFESNFENIEINQLKEELEETELIYKTKKKYLNDIKKTIKIKSENKENTFRDIQELTNNSKIFNEELEKLEKEFNEKFNTGKEKTVSAASSNLSNFITSSKSIIIDKNNLETAIQNLKKQIKINEKDKDALKENLKLILAEIEINQTIYVNILHEQYTLQKKAKFYQSYIEKFESFLKNIESEMFSLKSRLNCNKREMEKLEEDLNNKLYFIRFSNSLVRSFFNIINTRRLQIEMIKNLDKQEKGVYDFMFKKLDDLENGLINDYKEYLVMCEETEDNSVLY